MQWLDRMRVFKRLSAAESRANSYTDTLTSLLLDRASGSAGVAAAADTAAAEIAAGLVGRAFAAGTIEGAGLVDQLTPALLSSIGRDLILRGESLIVKGGADLVRAAVWDITGSSIDPRQWLYTVELPVPSGQQARRSYAGSEVAHCRYSTDSVEPWKGIGPLARSSLGGVLAANVVSALGKETSGPVGSLLPTPHDESIGEFKADIKNLDGGIAIVESTAAGWGEGRSNAPHTDYAQKRLGSSPPDSLVSLYGKSQVSIIAACGIPVELLAGSNQNAAREAFRRFLHSTLQPLARIVEPELSKLMGTSIRIDFAGLMASDIQGRARAFGSLVQGGMSIDGAMVLAGLSDE